MLAMTTKYQFGIGVMPTTTERFLAPCGFPTTSCQGARCGYNRISYFASPRGFRSSAIRRLQNKTDVVLLDE
jgi:hypothetical protein